MSQQTSNPAARTAVFVYGSLMSGMFNHKIMSRALRVGGIARTVGNFRLFDFGPFPGMARVGGAGRDTGQPVVGELYSVGPSLLERLDMMEGANHDGGTYVREQIDVTVEGLPGSVTAAAYLLRRTSLSLPRVPFGNWREHYHYKFRPVGT